MPIYSFAQQLEHQCFLFNNKLNFEAFFIKINMYVQLFTLHIQKNVHKKFKNCPKWPKSENGLKLVYVRKHPFFLLKD